MTDLAADFEFSLEAGRKSAIYRQRLAKGWELFIVWCVGAEVFPEFLKCVDRANGILVRFVQEMFDREERMWLVRHSVLAVQTKYFHLRGRIPRPWDALRGWKRNVRVKSRVPMLTIVLRCLFAEGLLHGLRHPRTAHFYICGAILLRVGFEALLRPQELMALTARDVSFVFFNQAWTAVLAIIDPKNRSSYGTFQFARVYDESVVKWLRWLVAGLPPAVKLWPSGRPRLVWVLDRLLGLGGFENTGYTLGSLRPGKATEMILAGFHPGTVKFSGRWASESAFSVYVQESMAMLVWSKLPPETETELTQSLESVSLLAESPPQVPWSELFTRSRQWRTLGATKKKQRTRKLW